MSYKKTFIVNKKSAYGLLPVCMVVVTTLTGEIFLPSIIDYLCDCKIINDREVCLTPIDEPVKQGYSDFYPDTFMTTVSGTATVSTASFSPSPSPSPAPDFS